MSWGIKLGTNVQADDGHYRLASCLLMLSNTCSSPVSRVSKFAFWSSLAHLVRYNPLIDKMLA